MSRAGLTRRPIRSRESRWAAPAAAWLTRIGARPNVISMLSVVFACAAAVALLLTRSAPPRWQAALFVVAALGIQLRLLCNLLDGMVAIEGGRKTRSGELFNELPDRLSDVLILVCAGYAETAATWGEALGWAAAVLAVLTAYVRAFGASLTGAQHFVGPMAKPHRMAVMTVACLAAAVQAWLGAAPSVLPLGLALVVVGCVVTLVRRTRRILADLEAPRG